MGDGCAKIYFLYPNKPFHNGIRQIQCDAEFAKFIDVSYNIGGGKASLFIDHFGDELKGWFVSGEDEVLSHDELESVIQGRTKKEINIENFVVDFDDLGEHYEMNKTRNDVFLSKLCMHDEDEVGQ